MKAHLYRQIEGKYQNQLLVISRYQITIFDAVKFINDDYKGQRNEQQRKL